VSPRRLQLLTNDESLHEALNSTFPGAGVQPPAVSVPLHIAQVLPVRRSVSTCL
jgi:hypothetical protein